MQQVAMLGQDLIVKPSQCIEKVGKVWEVAGNDGTTTAAVTADGENGTNNNNGTSSTFLFETEEDKILEKQRKEIIQGTL